ncbi:restriction endonuclease subunit S [Rhodobacteraceae bacterium CH30]|nr:restriction endonuclease subunit S [Rhodobacteraceae bacterium CH30]
MSLPKYPAYKDSEVEWLDAIPSHWSIAPLKRLLDIQNGADHKAVEVEEGISVIGSGGPFAFASEYLYDGESVLLGRKGTIDKPLYVSGKFWTVDTMYWSKVLPDTCGKYAYYAATTIPFSFYSTNTALPSMTKGALSAHLIARPPLAEQAVIATFLDRETGKIDRLIAEQEKLIALLVEKRQATISHAVTRGLDPAAPMKDSGVEWLGQVPAYWCVARVKAASLFTTSGPRGWSERITEDGSLFIQSGDLNDALGLEYETAKRVNVGDDSEAARTRLSEGDVVVCITGAKTGNVAFCSSLHERAYVNQHLCLIRPTNEVKGRFLAFALKSTMGQLQLELSQYGLKQGLSLENVREVWVTYPPCDEQEAVIAFLDAEMNKFTLLTQAANAAVNLLKERRAALIAAAVTGQIDVRGLVDAPASAAPEAA